MIGILVLTHGKLAEGLNDALRMIVGEVDVLDFLGLTPGEDLDAYAVKVKEKAQAIMSENGVLVLTDIVGGTPFNQATKLLSEFNLCIVTGVNLGMLLSAHLNRDNAKDIRDLAEMAIDEGKDSMMLL